MDGKRRRIALLVAGCYFMEMMDGTIVTTSAPRIGSSLDVASRYVSLVVTAYVITLAALIPLSGWIASRWSARTVFLAAIALFTLASIGCAASTSLSELVGMRVLQGVGGAMMVPVGRLVVLARAAKSELMRVTSYLVWPALIAPVIAPLAGGVITTYASWHWIFLINVPLGALAFAAASRLIDATPRRQRLPLDRLGVLLTCLGLAGLAGTAQLLSERAASLAPAAALALASALVLALAVCHLLSAREPLLNLRTLRIGTFGASLRGGALYFLVIGAGPFLFPLLFQEAFRWSPIKSGAVVLLIFVGNVGIKPATTIMYGRFGFRAVLAVSTASMAASMVAAAFLLSGTPLVAVCAVVLVSGIARSVAATGYTTLAFSDVPEEQMRDANVLQATGQQLALGLGVAVAAIALRAGEPLAKLVPGAGVTGPYAIAFLALALISLLATAGALRLGRDAGDVLRGSFRRPAAAASQESNAA
ncbi:MAG: MFS transporter [Solirubrobacteraceae bacterium]